MRLVISVTISSINRYKEPNNRYLFISERAAWDLIYKWKEVNSEFAYYSFRKACSIDAHPNKTKLINWAKKTNFSIKDLLLAENVPKRVDDFSCCLLQFHLAIFYTKWQFSTVL